MAVIELKTKNDFDNCLKDAGSKLVVVDFTATWCPPCQKIGPIFKQFSEVYTNAIFVKVDVDTNKETSEVCGISAMPTFQFYKNGEKLGELVGASEDKLKSEIEKFNNS